METERKLSDKIVSHLADEDAKIYPEWVESWLEALFTAYRELPDKNLLDGYKKDIEPLVFWLTPESRRWLGEALWQDWKDWHASHSASEPYPLTGLAYHLSPPVGGA